MPRLYPSRQLASARSGSSCAQGCSHAIEEPQTAPTLQLARALATDTKRTAAFGLMTGAAMALLMISARAGPDRALVRHLRQVRGDQLLHAPTGAAALRIVEARAVELILFSLAALEPMDPDLLSRLRQAPSRPRILALLSPPEVRTAPRNSFAGLDGWLRRPSDPHQLFSQISHLAQAARLARATSDAVATR